MNEPPQGSVTFAELGLKWKVGVVWMITAVGVNSYFGWTDTGLFPYVIALQDRVMGLHVSSLTFLVCLVPLLIPLFLVRSAVVRGLKAVGLPDPDDRERPEQVKK